MKKGLEKPDKKRIQLEVLADENNRLRAENKALRERVDYLIRQLFGRKSEKLNPNQLMLLLGLDEEGSAPVEQPNEEPVVEQVMVPKKKRRQIKERLPENLPVCEEIIDPPEVKAEPEAYRCIGEEVREELTLTPPKYFIRRIIRRKHVRKDDRSLPPVIAPAIPALIENSFASTELLVDIIDKKYIEHLPLYRQSQTLKRRYGIDISHKTMSGWICLVGNRLRIVYDEMKSEIRESGYIQADETAVKYIKPGAGKTKTGYLFAYHAPNIGVIFDWHCSRGAECLGPMLSSYDGDLQIDGYQAYRSFNDARPENERYSIYGCRAHARRKFHDAQNDSELSAEILSKIQALYKIETILRESEASHEERRQARIEQSKPILEEIKEMLDQALFDYRPQSLTGKAVSYTIKLWDNLEAYAETGHIEIDNNLVENAIRPTAIGKKNWLFFGSPDSGQQSAVIFSLLETCRKLGINQREYLTDILAKLPSISAEEARKLTPSSWLASHAEAVA